MWAYSKATILGYYRVLRTILTAEAPAEDACNKVGELKLAPIGDAMKKAKAKRGISWTREELCKVLGISSVVADPHPGARMTGAEFAAYFADKPIKR